MVGGKIRIATWNIRCGVPKNISPQKAKIADDAVEYFVKCLKNISPDIIALQEVLFINEKNSSSQAREIAKLAGYRYFEEWKFCPSHLIPNAKMGIAILSNYPIERAKKVMLPNPGIIKRRDGTLFKNHDKGILQSVINFNEQKILFINVHYFPFREFDRDPLNFKYVFEPLEVILNEASKRNQPLIVCGDFNTDKLLELMPEALTKCKYSMLVWTETRLQGLRHDNILCSKQWSNHKVWVIPSRSDHHICIAEAELGTSISSQQKKVPNKLLDPIYILHLSDVHFGKGIVEDEDHKSRIKGVKLGGRQSRFSQYMIHALPKKPDFVVVSGDFTNKGHESGFKEFIGITNSMIKKGIFPDAKKIIIVPGNHDLDQSGIGRSSYEKRRWEPFINNLGDRYTRPWINSVDPDIQEILNFADRSMSEDSKLWGGLHRDEKTADVICLPFILDFENNVLFYAFNSSSISGTNIMLPECVEKNIETIKHFLKKNMHNEMFDVINRLESELFIDPSRIDPEELDLFINIMDLVSERIGIDVFKKYLKIAVLHHHVAPISCSEEVKKFESLLNSGLFKYYLQQSNFHMILHGHKHWSEVFLDTAVSEGGSHIVISGGTIGGLEAKGKKPGFFWIKCDQVNKYVDIQNIELKPGGHTKKSFRETPITRMEIPTSGEKVGLIKSISKEKIKMLDIRKLYYKTNNALLKYLCTEKSDKTKILRGWSHRLKSNKISVIATAYGLLIMNLINSNDKRFSDARSDIIRTLWDFRLEKGGWSAISQPEIGRPEATAWALDAFYSMREVEKARIALKDLEEILDEKKDEVFFQNVFSISLVLRVLFKVSPSSPKIDILRKMLLSSATRNGDGKIMYWGENIIPAMHKNKIEMPIQPSVVHTAHAIIALINSYYAKNEISYIDVSSCFSVAAKWLLDQQNWDNREENIVRPIKFGKNDQLTVNHYSKPWIIIALLEAGADVNSEKIVKAIKVINENQDDGLWNWESVKYPIWATYDALNALTEYAFRASKYTA